MAALDSFLRDVKVMDAYKKLRERGPLRLKDIADDPSMVSLGEKYGVYLSVKEAAQPNQGPVDLRDRAGVLRNMVRTSEAYVRAFYSPVHECDLVAKLEAAWKTE